MFKTELHCHSAEVSPCATASTEHIIQRYIDEGYSTLVLTNHLSRYTFKSGKHDISHYSWEDKIKFFVDGYNKMKEVAKDKITILLGMELRFDADAVTDYLVYGITEEFLLLHPEILMSNLNDFSPVVRENNLLLIQAHPFRNGMTVSRPHLIDGVESYNGHPGHDSRNDVANYWANKFNLIKTSGSDFHHEKHAPCAGILTESKISSNKELIDILRSGKYELISSKSASI